MPVVDAKLFILEKELHISNECSAKLEFKLNLFFEFQSKDRLLIAPHQRKVYLANLKHRIRRRLS